MMAAETETEEQRDDIASVFVSLFCRRRGVGEDTPCGGCCEECHGAALLRHSDEITMTYEAVFLRTSTEHCGKVEGRSHPFLKSNKVVMGVAV